MLQQTQVDRVKIYFESILQAYPSIEDLAKTSYEEFFPYYKWLGYYSRARNMLKTAQKVSQEFWGFFPKETQALTKLPGVWPYTAEAIRAFAYDIPTLSFDTNLEKIFSRYYFGNKFEKLSQEEKQELLTQMQEFCNSLLNSLPWKGKEVANISRNINNALMDYGALVSLNTLSWIDWENYPFPESKFYQTRGSLEPIQEKKKNNFPTKQAYVICILHENHKRYFSTPVIPTDTGISLPSPHPSPLDEREQTEHFSPFFIGKNTWNPRTMIQQYFLEKYGLELSVRPPEIKSYLWDETPYIVCYAQIQSGSHNFQVFENLKVRGFEEGYIESMEFWGDRNLSLF